MIRLNVPITTAMALLDERRLRAGGRTWWTAALAVVTVAFGLAYSIDGHFGSMTTVFWFAVPTAALCVIASLVTLTVAWRDNNGELGLFGLFFHAVSFLALAHALTVPGVMYGPNTSSDTFGLLALPIALIAAWPLLGIRATSAKSLGRRWRHWTVGWLTILTVGPAILLIFPRLVPQPNTMGIAPTALLLLCAAVIVWISLRHLRLYRLSGLSASLVASIGLILLGVSSLGWIHTTPLSAAFWLSQVFDVTGVGLATVAAMTCYRQSTSLRTVVQPIVSFDPLLSLEVAMDPTVHAFVAMLENKDTITRDHVVRVADLSTRVALRAGITIDRLPALAVAAVLHDVGKLEIDDAILNKPGRLTAEEFEVMQTHAAIGADLLSVSPALEPAARLVRAHHERPDGQGYPDGLSGDELPLESRIISVCDAYDAITNRRQYRDGQGGDIGLSVLREHAGTQFDPVAVEWLAEEVGSATTPPVFRGLGTTVDPEELRAFSAACNDCARLVDSTHEYSGSRH